MVATPKSSLVISKVNTGSDAYIDANYFNECHLKSNSDKYLYRHKGVNFYDSKCSIFVDTATEKFVVENGLASKSQDVHKLAHWLIVYKNK